MSPACVTPEFEMPDETEPMPEIVPVPDVNTPFVTLSVPSTWTSPPLTAKLVSESDTPEGI